MNLSYDIINETIDYIMKANIIEENKNYIIEVLNNGSNKDIENLIKLNKSIFLRSPLIKELYDNSEIIIDYFEEYKDTDYELYKLLNYISKNFPQLNFFEQDFVINYINSNIDMVPLIYNFLEEPNKSHFIIKYLLDVDMTNFHLINQLSENALNVFFGSLSPKKIDELYPTFLNFYGNLNSYFEKKYGIVLKKK